MNVTGGAPAGPDTEVVGNNAPADNTTFITAKARFFESDGITPATGRTVGWSVQGGMPSGITLGTATQTDSGGWSSITVKNGQLGNRSVTLEASYGGTTRTVAVNFGAPVLSLGNDITASPANPAIGANSEVRISVLFADNSPAVNLPGASITWKRRNNASASATEATDFSGTDGSGTAKLTVTADFQHVMYVEASAGSTSVNITVQFGPTLPSGFIVGPGGVYGGSFSGKTLIWREAGNFCASQGGQLPAYMSYTISGGFPVPDPDLNRGNYWTREEQITGNMAYRLRGTSSGLIPHGAQGENAELLVVCVP